jgi:hypothetical protein
VALDVLDAQAALAHCAGAEHDNSNLGHFFNYCRHYSSLQNVVSGWKEKVPRYRNWRDRVLCEALLKIQ